MTQSNAPRPELELWGGLEATVNRVHHQFFDQIVRTGHHDRIADLDLFTGLGLRTLRYPLLWERTAPDGLETAAWDWADQRLEKLRELGIRPIVGLVHHGSGPRSTSLIDPAFPERLAEYAGAVAQRYPWVTDYTPVNEPLTTARFAALYGHWYPHLCDDASFARALLGQCRGIVLAMNAIRAVNPGARLIQTDDLGKTFSTERLAHQAAFENERRWITYDLLTGRLTPDHRMWQWFEWVGVARDELEWFQEHPCPPAIVGVNTYLSSQRFLDERIDRYPGETPGTNGRDTYVDVLANRVSGVSVLGVDALLNEAWQRFGLPLAVTETHNGGSREEQLRWLDNVWTSARRARRTGVDVRAVTVWALLGLFDWAQLVTRDSGEYEPGVFDVRGPSPRPTAIAAMVKDLATKGGHTHPALDVPGWWLRPDRFLGSVGNQAEVPDGTSRECRHGDGRPILVVGSASPLHDEVTSALEERKLSNHLFQVSDDTSHADHISDFVREHRPWAVVDVGNVQWWSLSLASVSHSFRNVAAARPGLADACADVGARLLLFSSDLVFDGTRPDPYTETDEARPVEWAGAHCVAAETMAAQTWPGSLIIRTGPLFGCDPCSPVTRRSKADLAIRIAASDDVISPGRLSDVVWNALELLVDQESGVWHLAGPDCVSWREFATIFERGSRHLSQDRAIESIDRHRHVTPRNFALRSERGQIMPPIVLS